MSGAEWGCWVGSEAEGGGQLNVEVPSGPNLRCKYPGA